MNRLFDIDRGNLVLNPTVLWIPEFKKLWNRDKSPDKNKAQAELSYVVFKHAFKSPYQAYNDREREKKIKADFLSEFPDWEPDKYVKAAEKKYNELQDTVTLRLFRSTRLALEKIEEFFKNADSTDVSVIVKNSKELGNLAQSLDKLEKQVQKEQLEASSVRGNAEIGLFEL